MNKGLWVLCLGVCLLFCVDPVLAKSWGSSGFESRIESLTDSLISILLPLVAILGLLYAAILAASGDEGAKKRMLLVIVASLIGFLAPIIIRWLQSIAGG